jgi:hypothetical protein
MKVHIFVVLARLRYRGIMLAPDVSVSSLAQPPKCQARPQARFTLFVNQ